MARFVAERSSDRNVPRPSVPGESRFILAPANREGGQGERGARLPMSAWDVSTTGRRHGVTFERSRARGDAPQRLSQIRAIREWRVHGVQTGRSDPSEPMGSRPHPLRASEHHEDQNGPLFSPSGRSDHAVRGARLRVSWILRHRRRRALVFGLGSHRRTRSRSVWARRAAGFGDWCHERAPGHDVWACGATGFRDWSYEQASGQGLGPRGPARLRDGTNEPGSVSVARPVRKFPVGRRSLPIELRIEP
jgi:hypothetical protein